MPEKRRAGYQVLKWQQHDIEAATRQQCALILLSLIEHADLHGVHAFCEKHPRLKNKLVLLNQWTPAMFAARYGCLDILKYLHGQGYFLESKGCPHGIVMSACFGNNLDTLKFLLRDCGLSPNPDNFDISPLRYCLKNGLHRLANLLIGAGAYYYLGPRLRQGVRKEDEKAEKYLNAKDELVHPDRVFKDSDVTTDRENARTKLRLARAYNLLALKSSAGVNEGFEYLRLPPGELKSVLSFMMPLD